MKLIDKFVGKARDFKQYLKLDEQERLVLAHIPNTSARAITKRELAAKTGMPERKVRQIIQHLIIDHGILIGSSTGQDGGYFIINSRDDYELALRHLEPRAKAILKRWAILKKVGEKKFYGDLFEGVG